MTGRLDARDRERLETLFDRAADLPAAERPAFVERECGSNEALRDELARLLAALGGEDRLGAAQDGITRAARIGARVGPYLLEERVGEGGMGEVWSARQLEPVERRVALKLIRPGMDSAQVVARFESERQALARMSHPHVTQVLDAGTTEEGRPYFAMEFVEGETITRYCDRRTLSTRARLELFLDVCAGVQHAHQKGLIHRDLKPGNLLVATQGERPVVKVIDFGVARATSGRLAEHTLHTLAGQLVGTLDYMSPEQAYPGSNDVDTRSDVHALGVVLYELISGSRPFDHGLTPEPSLSEIQRRICEEEPPTPSTRFKQRTADSADVARRRGVDERTLAQQLGGDLDWICLRALEKEPDRRYASVGDLAADVRRHLAHQPVLARRPGALYRARKFVRRNGLVLAATVLIGVAGFAGLLGVFSGRQVSRALRPQADAYELRRLELDADQLWPAHPHQIPGLLAWQDAALGLLARLPAHREALERMRARALPSLDGAQQLRFESDLDRSRYAVLNGLVEGLGSLRDDRVGLLGPDAISVTHGWSIPKRLAFARRLEVGFAADGESTRRWQQALPEIHAAYPGLELSPQTGLVPIGPDPVSERWEFWHVGTGAEPERDADGRLRLTEEMGVVLVLLPGGEFFMGAQRSDPDGQNYDPLAGLNESPVRRVTLTAFFLSKYELTRGQWRRITGRDPSYPWADVNDVGSRTPLHPVDSVSWETSRSWLERAGLALPSEAQWEYACRAGTETPWWTGRDRESLREPLAANLADQSAVRAHEPWGAVHDWPELDDGHAFSAEVGTYAANAFGLHEVTGNVWELCLDGYLANREAWDSEPDPLVPPEEAVDAVVGRGGCFIEIARYARSACREVFAKESGPGFVGVRPARLVQR